MGPLPVLNPEWTLPDCAASDVSPLPGSNPGGPGPHALPSGGANARSYLPALTGSTGGCTGGGGTLTAAAEYCCVLLLR